MTKKLNFDKDILEKMAFLLENGYLCIPIERDKKTAFYEVCGELGRNPHDVIRKDINTRTVHFTEELNRKELINKKTEVITEKTNERKINREE